VRSWYGALGLSAGFSIGSFRLSSEATWVDAGDVGIFTQASWLMTSWAEWTASLRYLGPNFDNPHTGVYAAADETSGSRARNERGILVTMLLRPWHAWRFATWVDVWQRAHAAFSLPQIRFLPQAQWKLTQQERLVATFQQQPSLTRIALEMASQRRLSWSLKAWYTWRGDASGIGSRLLGKLQIVKGTELMAGMKYDVTTKTCYATWVQNLFDSIFVRARYEFIVPQHGVWQQVARLLVQYVW